MKLREDNLTMGEILSHRQPVLKLHSDNKHVVYGGEAWEVIGVDCGVTIIQNHPLFGFTFVSEEPGFYLKPYVLGALQIFLSWKRIKNYSWNGQQWWRLLNRLIDLGL